MPSRVDRERLFLNEKTRERVKLWDYFFRVKPEDIGRPQREEIRFLIEEIRTIIKGCKQREEDVLRRTQELRRSALEKAIKRLVWGIVVFIMVMFVSNRIFVLETISIRDKYIYGIVVSFCWLVILVILISIGYLVGGERREIRWLALALQEFKTLNSKKIAETKKRIYALKKGIARLRRQIPKPLTGEEARKWLNGEFQKLWDYTKVEVALVRDIINIQSENPSEKSKEPLSVLGPGELQEKIPRQFLADVNENLHKHLGAKQAYQLNPENYGDRYDVLYGVYFLEYIVVGADMLVTHSFFYDFIEDKVTSEYTTEQYYTDVVALAIEKEVRKLTILDNTGKPASVYIEDSPAFTLSLKSGEKHQVSFVNQDYFIKVREKLEISLDDVGKIYWINQARTVADNVIKALRSYIRKHKTL